MNKIEIKFNDDAQDITGFVGIIGDSKENQTVITEKIKKVIEDAIESADKSDPEGLAIDRKQVVRNIVDTFTPEEVVLLATEAINQRLRDHVTSQNPLASLMKAMMEGQGK